MAFWKKDKDLESKKLSIREVAEVCGLNVFDPRDNTYKMSNNPALVMLDLAMKKVFIVDWKATPDFFDKIGKLADFCDEHTTERKVH